MASNIFGSFDVAQGVTVNSTQEVFGKKRFLNPENEFEGVFVQPSIQAVNTTISPTELSYLDGVTSNIQSQLAGFLTVADANNYYLGRLGTPTSLASVTTFNGAIVSGSTITATSLSITDGVTTNTVTPAGYTTRNSVQNATHFINFSDSSATGTGAIQKNALLNCNPATGNLGCSTLNATSGAFQSTDLDPEPTIVIRDTATTDALWLLPNASFGTYNHRTVTGDSLIVGANSQNNVSNLTVTTYSDTLTGVRITPTTTSIAAGGASSVPQSEVKCEGANVTVTGTLVGNMNITDTNTSNNYYPVFVSGSGGQALRADVSTGPFVINPSTGAFSFAETFKIETGAGSRIAIGHQAGSTLQGSYSFAIGNLAGYNDQGAYSLALGLEAARLSQGDNATAVGTLAGHTSQGDEALALGRYSGRLRQGAKAIAIGNVAGETDQGIGAFALGDSAGYLNQGSYAVAVGISAGKNNQLTNAVAIGRAAGETNQKEASIAIGYLAGNSGQLANGIAIGQEAGKTSQGIYSIAMGAMAGQTNQGSYSLAFGNNTANNAQGQSSVAIGHEACNISQGSSSVSIGAGAGVEQGDTSVAIGAAAGVVQAGNNVAIGASAGTSQGSGSVAVGYQAGQSALASSIAIGSSAGQTDQKQQCVAVGFQAGRYSQQSNAIAIGTNAGQGVAGTYAQQPGAIAIGLGAGQCTAGSQGINSIAIGTLAASTGQTAGSICINASGSSLAAGGAGFFIKPIRSTEAGTGLSALYYNTASSEVLSAYFPEFWGPTVTAAKVLDLPIARNYLISAPTSYTITLPAPAAHENAKITFRRSSSTGAITFNCSVAASVIPITNNTAVNGIIGLIAGPPAQYSTSFICNGTFWYQIHVQ